MKNVREMHEIEIGRAWGEICNRAGMKHDGLYNIETQPAGFAAKLGELMFAYMTDMSDNTDGFTTRDIASIALFFEDVRLYDENRK